MRSWPASRFCSAKSKSSNRASSSASAPSRCNAVLRLKTPISKLRGNWQEVRGIKMMPTFHPAYLLRNPGDKRLVWSDIQEVMKSLGLPITGRGGNA